MKQRSKKWPLQLAAALCLTTFIAKADVLDAWLGSDVSLLTAQFDRYDLDIKTGKLSGPSKGKMELRRPGYFSLTMEGESVQRVEIRDGFINWLPCEKCFEISESANKRINDSLVGLLYSGAAIKYLQENVSTVNPDGTVETNYSLAALGIASGTLKLWSYKGIPTVAEVSFAKDKRSILQFSSLDRNNLQGAVP